MGPHRLTFPPWMSAGLSFIAGRPADCSGHGACMWADALVHLENAQNGRIRVTVTRGAAWPGPPPPPPEGALPAPSTEDTPRSAADAATTLISALSDPPRPLSDTCVGVLADQSLSFGDVMTFRSRLSEAGARRVEMANVAADE